MAQYAQSGNLVTESREIATSETWASQSDWEAYQERNNVEIANGSLQLAEAPDIPDSEADQKLAHRWLLDDVNSIVVDLIGSADGSNNGVTSVAGDYAGGSAGDGNGADNDIVADLNGFGSEMSGGFAVAWTMETEEGGTDKHLFGHWDVPGRFTAYINEDSDFNNSDGAVSFTILDNNSDQLNVSSTSQNINDGGKYRIVVNVPDPSQNDIEVWVNQTDHTDETSRNDNPSDFTDLFNEFAMFAVYDGNETIRHTETVLDDICLYDDSLTSAEIGSYNNPWI